MQINYYETQLQLIYDMSDFEELVDYIESIPNNIAIQRRNNYHITDNSSNIQYQVSFKNSITKAQLLLIFEKEVLITQDITDLKESLEEKLKKQQKLMCKLFEDSQQISFSQFKSIEYSPTHLVFEIKLGNIVECRFCISHIIGNSLMDITCSEFNIHIINVVPSQNEEIFKSPPLNIQLYFQQKNLQEIFDLTYNTFIPIQVLNSKFQDPSLAYFCVSEVVKFTPNLKFGNFEFRCNLEEASLFISMQTTFINDALAIAIFEGNGLATLKGCKRRIDYQYYQTKIKSFIKKWEFSTFQEVEDFFKDFLYFTLGYVILYSNIHLLFDIKNYSLENVFKDLLPKIQRLTLSFLERELLKSEQGKQIHKQVIDHYFQGIICKYHSQEHKMFLQFLDKLVKNIKYILQTVPILNNLKEIESKLKSVQLSFIYKHKKIIITIEHHNQYYEYEFFNNDVVKLNFQEQVKSWQLNEFPQTEIDFILNRFQVKQ